MSKFADLIREKQQIQFELYEKHLNHQLSSVLKTLGFNKQYVKAQGSYLYDINGDRFLDLLSGFGVFAAGRNHPKIIEALKEVLELDLANMVQFDCPPLACAFAERLVKWMPPEITKFFFCNSGTEAVEGAIKFSRAATKREQILYCDHAFHGLTTGSLAVNGTDGFRYQFEPFIKSEKIAFGELYDLEEALRSKKFACFIIEPIQGKTVEYPHKNYFWEASKLCKKYGTLLVIDEIQTGVGRTGKFSSFEHWEGVDPDIITMAKALSGGFVPIGVIAMKEWIFNKTYINMEHSAIHSSTFGRNNLAMAAGIAMLDVLEEEDLMGQAASKGEKLLKGLKRTLEPFEMVKEVRGIGMMMGVEFCPPTKSLSLKTGWKLIEAANTGLFCQLIAIPLFEQHHMLIQVAGPKAHTIKLLPPLNISDEDVDNVIHAFEDVVAQAHRFPGAVWGLGKTLAKNVIKSKIA